MNSDNDRRKSGRNGNTLFSRLKMIIADNKTKIGNNDGVEDGLIDDAKGHLRHPLNLKESLTV
jgi:hypothetical protein